MNKNTVASAFAVLAFLITLPASAGVIYRWQDVTPNSNTGLFEGLIEFSYDVWSPGAHLNAEGSYGGSPGQIRPIHGIERFSWSNPSELGLASRIDMALRPCSALEMPLPNLCGDGDEFLTSRTSLSGFDTTGFDFTFGALLFDGSLYANNDQADVRMSGSGAVWTIEHVASDVGGACYASDSRCSGGTGIWVLDLSTLPTRVPEPSAVGLMLLGLSALLGARLLRRRTVSLATRVSVSVALLISAVPASAGVIYRWQDITPNPHTGSFRGEIEFSYDVWSPDGHFSDSGYNVPQLDPILGIERFHWSNPSGVGFINIIETTLRPCSAFVQQGLDYDCDALGLPEDVLVMFPVYGDVFRADFQFTFGSVLEGSLSVNNNVADVTMRSVGPLWTINRTGSEGNGGFCWENDGRCWGSTGIWALDLSTLPPVRVPEPSSAVLMLIGLAALFGCGRKLSM